MSKILVIGSTCVDVLLNVTILPKRGEDTNIANQELNMGGCAYNVFTMLNYFSVPSKLCSPVGSGVYGDFVENTLKELDIPIFAKLKDIPNGCCYCVIDSSGERTFMCEHGAEYVFKREFYNNIDMKDISAVFVCGLEIEETTGEAEIVYLEELSDFHKKNKLPFTIYFAPSPRICFIQKERMERMLKLSPFLHLNRSEALRFTKTSSVEEAAKYLYSLTGNSLVITLGSEGALFLDSASERQDIIPAIKTNVVDTVGAGDAHLGTVMAGLYNGMDLKKSVLLANKVSSYIVGIRGSTMSKIEFDKFMNGFSSLSDMV